jgi:3D (Asp-Asp-Asp) domain-containing protein
MVNGVVYTAEDMGSGVNGKHLDIYYNTHGEARLQGVQYAEVFLVQ